MQTLRRLAELRSAVADIRRIGGRVALVPTMGALHAGHVALVEAARTHADCVAVSIFVNSRQFAAHEDLGRYPRREAEDAALLDGGCDLLWMPDLAAMYPEGFATSIAVSGVSDVLEGAARPGHFDGVATVVAKLFNQVRPDVALFGEKDFQQLAVIRRMTRDLDLPIDIVGVTTVRDADGLALSSRNAYLSADARQKAVALPRALARAAARIGVGAEPEATLSMAREELAVAGFESIDYVALVDAGTLRAPTEATAAMRLLAAATIEGTRLIDNVAIGQVA